MPRRLTTGRCLAAAVLFLGRPCAAQDAGGLGGHAPLPPGSRDCVPPGPVNAGTFTPGGPLPESPPVYRFWPQGATLFRDVAFVNYVDLDATIAIRDYFCNTFSYNGHTGLDVDLQWFEEQLIGVPVFAAVDGVVTEAVDGNPDMNTSCSGPANYVAIDHGGGWRTVYYHLKRDSVAVSPAQSVRAGQQIGLTGSSGCSTHPHLHFGTYYNGLPVEAFAGSCRPGESLWRDQPAMPTGAPVILTDFGVSRVSPATGPGFPHRPATSPEILLSDPRVYFFARTYYTPPFSTWRVQFRRPNGFLAFDSGNVPFNNGDWIRSSWSWWQYSVADMHSIAGTWTLTVFFNAQKLIDAPVRVVAALTGANHPPEPVSASFDPANPSPSVAVFARLAFAPGLSDTDWDVVRYRYHWRVNGQTIRDVVSAGLADCVPHGVAANGDTLSCTVTPSDGSADGAPVEIVATVRCVADYDANAFVSGDDFDAFVEDFVLGLPGADINLDGFVTGDDFDFFIGHIVAGS